MAAIKPKRDLIVKELLSKNPDSKMIQQGNRIYSNDFEEQKVYKIID